jgi:hypothetical protein
MRIDVSRKSLGPSGHHAMKERVLNRTTLKLGCNVAGARALDSQVELTLARQKGGEEKLRVDHVIAATGFRIDIAALNFLNPALRSRIRHIDGAPVLGGAYECSVPGVSFVGPAAADSYGPAMRFVVGGLHTSRNIAGHISHRRGLTKLRTYAPPLVVTQTVR